MNFGSRKFLGIGAVVILVGAAVLFFATNFGFERGFIHSCFDRSECRTFLMGDLSPGDIRLGDRLRYFDVLKIEAHIEDPSMLPQGITFTDEEFTRIAQEIFERTFKYKYGKNSGILFAKEGDSYTFESNPHMVKIEFVLRASSESARYSVGYRMYRTLWGKNFSAYYGHKHDPISKQIEDITNYPESREKWKEKMLTTTVYKDSSEAFTGASNRDVFMDQIMDSIKDSSARSMKDAKPEPRVAADYTIKLKKILTEGK